MFTLKIRYVTGPVVRDCMEVLLRHCMGHLFFFTLEQSSAGFEGYAVCWYIIQLATLELAYH